MLYENKFKMHRTVIDIVTYGGTLDNSEHVFNMCASFIIYSPNVLEFHVTSV